MKNILRQIGSLLREILRQQKETNRLLQQLIGKLVERRYI